MRKKHVINLSLTIIFTIIFIYALFHFDIINEFMDIYKKINAGLILFCFFIYVFSFLARSMRNKILLENKNIKLSQIIQITLAHGLFNRILPMRLGEASFPILMKKYVKTDMEISLSMIVVCRVYDTIICFFLLFLSTFFISSGKLNLCSVRLWGIAMMGLLLSAVLNSRFFLGLLVRGIHKLLKKGPVKIQKAGFSLCNRFDNISLFIMEMHSKGVYLKFIFLSLLNWIILFILYNTLSAGFDFNGTFFEVSFAVTVSNLANILPFTALGGVGSSDIGFAGGFLLLGKDMKRAFSVSVSASVLQLIFILILGSISFIGLIFEKKHSARENKQTDLM